VTPGICINKDFLIRNPRMSINVQSY
jgi:hypothetical protein